ncbi:MAG: YdiU family protein [Gammaproteobacteria bacterium]|nr:YdiU family protein [Gammaproteobacteria bacterium]
MTTFESRFVDMFPADTQTANHGRQVHDALYSRVLPTPVSAPTTLIWSRDVAACCGFDADFCGSPEFAQVFAGNKQLPGMRPYASRYGGHQFGNWAGQLGDGRVINLGEVSRQAPGSLTLQLKGAGPTPYSRGADGRAVLRSSIREFLCSEAMHFLGVPTTRALSLVLTGDSVVRDMFYDGNPEEEPGAVVCRVAPSFIRFGHFQLCAARGEHELLRRLLDFTITNDFQHLQTGSNSASSRSEVYSLWFDEVCRLTADMIVHWFRVGFVHGVMNTDNMSVLGLTIDYGPYGWVDNYDLNWTPNTTDSEMRRYRYGHQAAIAQWNLWQLANSIAAVTGDTGSLELSLKRFSTYYETKKQDMLASKLGLRQFDKKEGDEELLASLDVMLQQQETDMTLFYRALADFDPNNSAASFLDTITCALYAPVTPGSDESAVINAWGVCYARRVLRDNVPWQERRNQMNSVNPRFVLRNYLAQEVIDKAHAGDYEMLHELHSVLMQPYAEQADYSRYAQKRPEWARHKPGSSSLSCSS